MVDLKYLSGRPRYEALVRRGIEYVIETFQTFAPEYVAGDRAGAVPELTRGSPARTA
jgi:hypothetical protein